MSITPAQSPTPAAVIHGATRLLRGALVVTPMGAFATVVDFPDEERVRVCYTTGGATVLYQHEVRTRAEALRHWNHMTALLARELGDQGLEDATEQSAVYVERAAQQCDAADAVRGLS